MSLYDYQQSQLIAMDDPPFYALIMAAMRRADTDSLRKLADAFPETFTEFKARYDAPGGYFPHEWERMEQV